MNLQLSLKKEWFEKTKSGGKTEDYREITPYFCNKFLLFNKESKSKQWWYDEFFKYGTLDERIENIKLFTSFKDFNFNIMTLGYPKSDDFERILKLKHKGIEIRTGKTEWGAVKDNIYFVIMHGLIQIND